MTFTPSGNFKRKLRRVPQKIKHALDERLRLFVRNPFDVRLNNHSLHGSLRSYRSINITSDWRLVYEQYDENAVRLIDIDTHSHLYDH